MKPVSTPLILETLDSLKIPLIGSGGAVILSIVLMMAIKILRNQANSGVSVIVKNSASASNNAPTCPESTETSRNPQPSYNYKAMDIEAILAVPASKRNPFERQKVARYSERLKSNPQNLA